MRIYTHTVSPAGVKPRARWPEVAVRRFNGAQGVRVVRVLMNLRPRVLAVGSEEGAMALHVAA